MTWNAVVERWTNEAMLYVPELPGFFSKEPNVAQAFAVASDTSDSYLKWLESEEIAADLPKGEAIVIIQELPGADGKGPIFDLDRESLDEDQFEAALTIGRVTLSDLLYSADVAFDDHETEVRRMLRHVAELDRWYAMRLKPGLMSPIDDLESDVIESASFFEETVDAIFSEQASLARTLAGEEWTLPKVLRRRTVHLREHLFDLLALPSDE